MISSDTSLKLRKCQVKIANVRFPIYSKKEETKEYLENILQKENTINVPAIAVNTNGRAFFQVKVNNELGHKNDPRTTITNPIGMTIRG